MYAEDSFHTLSVSGQIGLIVLSLALFRITISINRRVTRRVPIPAQIISAVAALWLFVWLSPQIYYLYYLTIFEGLPFQNVIRQPPSPMVILRLITFLGDATLSAQAQGALFWALVASVLLRRKLGNNPAVP